MADPRARFIIGAEDRSARAFSSVRRRFRALASTATSTTNLLRGGLAFLGISATLAGLKNANDRIEKIGRDAQRLKIAPEFLSALGYAAEQSGADLDSVTTGIEKMSRRIQEASRGKGEAIDMLKLMGFSPEAISELARLKPDQLFLRMMRAFEGRKTVGGRNLAIAKIADDEAIRSFGKILDSGGLAGLTKAMDEAGRIGAVISQDDVNKAIALSEGLGRLGAVLQRVMRVFVLEFEPMISSFGQFLVDNMPSIRQTMQDIGDVIGTTAGHISVWVERLTTVAGLFDKIWNKRKKAEASTIPNFQLSPALTDNSAIARVANAGLQRIQQSPVIKALMSMGDYMKRTALEVADPANSEVLSTLRRMTEALSAPTGFATSGQNTAPSVTDSLARTVLQVNDPANLEVVKTLRLMLDQLRADRAAVAG